MASVFFWIDAWIMGLVLLCAMLAAWGMGISVGRRMRRRVGEAVPGGGKVEDACLALLGLLLAFTFATAYTRFDARRDIAVKEANRIRTFWERVELLPEPQRSQVRDLTRQYVRERVNTVHLPAHVPAWHQHDRQTRAILGRIVAAVNEAGRQMPPSAVLAGIIAAMNEMGDEYESRVTILTERVPWMVLALLFAVCTISTFLLGRTHGIAEKHHPLATIVFILLVALLVYVILALDQPRRGLIRVSQESMLRLAESMGVTPT